MYSVTPVTITSGDFIVGFVVDNPANVFPTDVDTLTTSKQRSYVAVGSATIRSEPLRLDA